MRVCDLCQKEPAVVIVAIQVTEFFADRETKETAVTHDVCERCRHAWKDRVYGADDDARRDAERERRVKQ